MTGAEEMPRNVWAGLHNLNISNISVSFKVDWNLPRIVADVAGFLCLGQSGPLGQSISQVGMLCHPELAQLFRHQMPTEACFMFQAMLYGTSLAYLRPNQQIYADSLPKPTLIQLAAAAGHRFLHYLDQQLQVAELAVADIARRQSLFILVFGTILAVSYSYKTQAATTPSESKLLYDMSTHLCERLAHHLVLLSQSLGFVFDKNKEQVVLRRPLFMWDREGWYSWRYSVVPDDRYISLVRWLAAGDRCELSDALLDGMVSIHSSRRGLSTMDEACLPGICNMEIFKRLLVQADPARMNDVNISGRTPLQSLCFEQDSEPRRTFDRELLPDIRKDDTVIAPPQRARLV